ncbi:MAG: GGDEF domain-containing protein [Deltaproteobacteria bacterium]|nr:GGDEF domain-containing protein [Deltaproteobacteria bacterium]
MSLVSKKAMQPPLALWARLIVVAGLTYVIVHLAGYILVAIIGQFGDTATALPTAITWWKTLEAMAVVTAVVVVSGQAVRRRVPRPPAPVAIDPWLSGLAHDAERINLSPSVARAVIRDLSLLYAIGRGISATIELDELLNRITELLQRHLRLREFAVLLLDDEGQYLQVKAAYGFPSNLRVQDMIFQMGEGVSGEVVRTGEQIYVPDVTLDQRYLSYRGELPAEGALLSLPLRYKKEILGVVNFGRKKCRSFSDSEIRLLALVANQISLAIANARLYSKTRELAVRDDLTGLYNRRHFLEVLQIEWKRAVRFHRGLAVLMLDVDHFKAFNDDFGHLHGDHVLREISALLRRNLREVDTLARFGGEEFIALLPDTDRDGAIHVGEKLRRMVELERFQGAQQAENHPMTVSIGISVYPDDALQMDDLIDHADIALYEAKDGGRNKTVCYPANGDASAHAVQHGTEPPAPERSFAEPEVDE